MWAEGESRNVLPLLHEEEFRFDRIRKALTGGKARIHFSRETASHSAIEAFNFVDLFYSAIDTRASVNRLTHYLALAIKLGSTSLPDTMTSSITKYPPERWPNKRNDTSKAILKCARIFQTV
jgi:hypothetical protein